MEQPASRVVEVIDASLVTPTHEVISPISMVLKCGDRDVGSPMVEVPFTRSFRVGSNLPWSMFMAVHGIAVEGQRRPGSTARGPLGVEFTPLEPVRTPWRPPELTGGTYTLLLRLDEPVEFTVGALGTVAFEAGWYAYTGSAQGPGGFARVDRHRRVATEGTDAPHWHVDYLLPRVRVADVYTLPGADLECEVARSLPGERVAGFGASDCPCSSHLAVSTEAAPLRAALEGSYGEPDR